MSPRVNAYAWTKDERAIYLALLDAALKPTHRAWLVKLGQWRMMTVTEHTMFWRIARYYASVAASVHLPREIAHAIRDADPEGI